MDLPEKSMILRCRQRFVSTYNKKHRSFLTSSVNIIKILLLDQRLALILPSIPQITFRKAPPVKNILAPSKMKTLNKKSLFDIRSYLDHRTGIFQCRKKGCLSCQFITHGCSNITTNKGNHL